MLQFLYWLKALTAVLITNSHYAHIWPISSLAVGGQLGNCLFFFISGFTLYHIKAAFPKWYAKRIIRVYPALWMVNIIFFLLGRFSADSLIAVIHCFIFPTWFHFVGSIMLLYLFYYFIRTIQKHWKIDTRWIMLAVLILDLVLYLVFFDKTYYHIDDVERSWVRFMFFESMLIGAWFREQYDRISPRISAWHYGLFAALSLTYFGGKLLFSRVPDASAFQFLLPVILLIYVGWIAVLFIKFEKNCYFTKITSWMSTVIKAVADMTLEIYLVQFPLIDYLHKYSFPVNFLLTTGAILLCAWITHFIAIKIKVGCEKTLHLE